MKTISLTLSGCSRLALNGPKTITYKPKNRVQLVLGTNGSGKSSLVAEMNHLPIDTADYSEGGYKEFVSTRNGHVYKSLSVKSKNGIKCSFTIDDGEELNPGGTASVQRTLVYQEFGMTSDIFYLITGQEAFTSMSPSKRREWFTTLSEVSYDLAIAVFTKMKEKLRDRVGAIRMQKTYLMEETGKLINDEQMKELEERQAYLNTTLTSLYAIARPKKDEEAAANQWRTHLAELERVNAKMASIAGNASDLNLPVLGTYSSNTDYYHGALALENGLYNKYIGLLEVASKELDDALLKYDLLTQTGKETLESLLQQEATLTTQIETFNASLITGVRNYLVDGCSCSAAHSNYAQIKDELVELLSGLPENGDRRYSKQNLLLLERELEETKHEIQKRHAKADALRMEIARAEHRHNDGLVTCPQCEFGWSLSDTASIVDDYRRRLGDLVDEGTLAALDKRCVELSDSIDTNRAYGERFTSITRLGRVLNDRYFAANAWRDCFPVDEMYASPKKLAALALDIDHDLELLARIETLSIKLADIERLIRISKDTESYNADELQAKITDLNDRIAVYNKHITSANKNASYFREVIKTLDALERVIKEYDEITEKGYNLCSIEVIDKLNAEIHKKICDVQIALSSVSERLINAGMQSGIVADIAEKITILESEKKLLDRLVHHLSPTDGLIADGLTAFITSYVARMNSFIRKVWAYPLVIKVDLADGIDFKFPLMVKDKDNVKSDVSKGSTGMREIIDLAYRVVAMKYLGFDNHAIILDEFAKTMDDAHKAKATELIKSLVEQEDFSQFFIVSHDIRQYGAFSNSDVCVLCSKNVVIPDGVIVNEHVVFA